MQLQKLMLTAAAVSVIVFGPTGTSFEAATAHAQATQIKTLPTRVPAPSLDGGVDWLNTAGPLSLRQLRGKYVVLDFWTYCCINCLHTLPELQELERAHPNEVVVIGVHSPKFFAERESADIRDAIVRYGVEHPVLNDANGVLWRKYGIKAWPSLRIIDPEGFLIGTHAGEATFEMLDRFIRRSTPSYRAKGAIDDTPLYFDLERSNSESTPLLFPGKVLADEAGGRLFIADSGHNRIVITKLDGTLMDIVGTGAIGRSDGGYDEAAFDHPQGMALEGDSLYVADTENHLIRKVQLNEKRVSTIAGTGQQARDVVVRSSPRPESMPLASPWALCIHEDQLYIAMAGQHQIWKMALDGSRIGPFAGNGIEDIVDGPLLPRKKFQSGFASFAQPSGLATDGRWLYVADSEGSSIRAVPVPRGPRTATVIGTAHVAADRLFAFGDFDGLAGEARMQHPLGIAHYNGRLFVADTYNHKIKEIDLTRPAIRTIAGTREPGKGDSPPQFSEPSGLSIADGKLYVADTNNHTVRVLDLERDFEVRTLRIDGLAPPQASDELIVPEVPGARAVKLGTVEVKPVGGQATLAVKIELPDGHKLNPLAPMSYFVEAEDETVFAPETLNRSIVLDKPNTEFEIRLPLLKTESRSPFTLLLTFYHCVDGAEGLCKVGAVNWSGELKLSPDAVDDRLSLEHIVRGD